jgi:hypothetical protein
MTGNPVVLINRTSRVLTFVADGKQYELTPGENYGFNSAQARFAKAQNPLMGSEDYHTLRTESLVAIKGSKDPVDEISDEVLNAAPLERFDRSSMPGASNVKSIRARHQMLGRIEGAANEFSQAIGG